MATVYYKGLTGVRDSVTGITLTTTTIDQLVTAIAADEGLPTDYYKISLDGSPGVNDIVYGDSSTKLSAIGFTDGCTVICTTKQVGSKEERQIQKLEIAQLKRSGSAGDGSSVDIPGYRILNTYNRQLLPTQYIGNTVVDNTNTGGLVNGRPWTGGPIYTAGVFRYQYSGYATNLVDIPFFAANLPTGGSAVTNFTTTTATANLAYQFIGYILPDYTGTWTFSTNGVSVDDAFTVWVGDYALSGYTAGNATFSVSLTSGTGTASLTSGVYTPIRIQFGNNAGPGSCDLYFSRNASVASNVWTGKLFYNLATNGF